LFIQIACAYAKILHLSSVVGYQL